MNRLGSCFGAAAMIVSSQCLAAEVHTDLSYGPRERNVLDLFLPDEVDRPPLVMYVHGGAWFRGDKNQVEKYDRLRLMNEAGLAVATINYTWSQQATWPAQKEDLVNAIRFLQENANTYGYDMSKFGVWGQSSGAHLALWTAILDKQDPTLGVDAVVSWYGPSNLHALWQDRLDDDVPGGNEREPNPTPESQLLGIDLLEAIDAADAASPEFVVRHLDDLSDLPPILLVHGTADPRVSPLQSKRMYQSLKDNGATVDLIMVPGGGHGGEGFDAAVAPSLTHLKQHMQITSD